MVNADAQALSSRIAHLNHQALSSIDLEELELLNGWIADLMQELEAVSGSPYNNPQILNDIEDRIALHKGE